MTQLTTSSAAREALKTVLQTIADLSGVEFGMGEPERVTRVTGRLEKNGERQLSVLLGGDGGPVYEIEVSSQLILTAPADDESAMNAVRAAASTAIAANPTLGGLADDTDIAAGDGDDDWVGADQAVFTMIEINSIILSATGAG